MNHLIALLILFSTMSTKQTEYISIEHIGISDKPIGTIVIYKGGASKTLNYDNYDVSDTLYQCLKKAILSYKGINYKGHDFGSFKIIITNNKGSASYYLDRGNSIKLFHELIEITKQTSLSSSLQSRLEVQAKRITY